MQTLSSKNSDQRPSVIHPQHESMLPFRLISGIEVASVLASVLITTWMLIPLQPEPRFLIALPGLFTVFLMLNSHRVRNERFADVGLSLRNFGQASRLLALPMLIVCLIITVIGFATHSFHQTSHFWGTLIVVPVWAMIQQYALQAFIFRRMCWLFVSPLASFEERKKKTRWAILATATIFSLAHLPNPMLMLLTFLGALLWSWVYDRAPNLVALALSHTILSLMLMTSMPSWFLPSMSVGYKHFLYQKF
ncbi:MAG: CPBP family intramembrane metalloprotease [Acidobacteria bacterium]|nr:CPBP family intramembrane metalloprotease [Acidobacteriota bacterium]